MIDLEGVFPRILGEKQGKKIWGPKSSQEQKMHLLVEKFQKVPQKMTPPKKRKFVRKQRFLTDRSPVFPRN